MTGLIGAAFEHIEQLKFLYETEIKHIETIAKKGMNKNHFAHEVDAYVYLVLYGDKELLETEHFKSFEKYIKKFVEIMDSDGDSSVIIKVNEDAKAKFGNNASSIMLSAKEYRRYYNMVRIFNEQTIIMLLVKFENIIAEIFAYLYRKYPDRYLNNEKISYSDILKVGEENIKNHIIEVLVDHTMRESIDEWCKKFQSHNINLKDYSVVFDNYLELHFRRNIIVHNAGKVNDAYLKGIEKTSLPKTNEGKRLTTNKEYVLHAFETIECLLFAIFIECKRIQDKDEKDKYIENIFNTGFEFLYRNENKIGEFVFSQLEKEQVSETYILMSTVNRWIAQKRLYGLDKIKTEISEYDFSAKDISFRIAQETLLENYETVSNELEKAFPETITADALLEWPLFEDYRNSREFECFKEMHPEEFNLQQISPTNNEETLSGTIAVN